MKVFSAPLRVSASPREPRPGTVGRRAFTLVEMLVVVAIIGILASTLLGALFVATEHARAERTRSLISKLHNQMMQRWEEYETRRVPLTVPAGTNNMDDIATAQLIFLNEIMRMELPDQYEDLNLGHMQPFYAAWGAAFQNEGLTFGFVVPLPAGCTRPDPNPMTVSPEIEYLPALTRAYCQRVVATAIANGADPGDPDAIAAEVAKLATDNQSAEMLYLIMTTASGDEDSGGIHFSAKDEGDTDGDGMLEFLDAWGNPIEWIRWPAGFANINTTDNTLSPGWGLVTDLISAVPTDDPDPFDPRRVRATNTALAPTTEPIPATGPFPNMVYSFRLAPLIMSPGPDNEYGVVFRRKLASGASAADQATLRQQESDPFYFWEDTSGDLHRKGMPARYDVTTGTFSSAGDWVHLDNITNHLTEAE